MRLHPTTLPDLPAGVRQPGFDRTRLEPGIVHLGIGAFARAHLLPVNDAAIERSGDLRWGVVGVSLRQPDTRDALQPQSGLYTLALRDECGSALQVVGSLIGLRVAPEDPAAVLQLMAAPATRIVSLTVTEKGYCHDPASGALQRQHPDIVHDLEHPLPRSAPGFIVRALQQRRAVGLGGLTLLSCDNLPSNGDTLRGVVLALAAVLEPGLDGWIGAHCSFPNGMVDRIVPRTTAADRHDLSAALGMDDAWPVLGEPFLDWAVEGRFVAGRPDWTAAGARFVPAAAPFEKLKLRMVNGSHSALAYLGPLAGIETVDQALARPELRGFIDALMHDEVAPTLPPLPGLDLDVYRARLLQRFANPVLKHRLLQIAMDGSQKLPQRWLGTVRDRLAHDLPIERLSLAVAAWLRFVQGRDEQGLSLPLDDPLAAQLRPLAGDLPALLNLPAVFGDLGRDTRFVAAVQRQSRRLHEHGALAAAAHAAAASMG